MASYKERNFDGYLLESRPTDRRTPGRGIPNPEDTAPATFEDAAKGAAESIARKLCTVLNTQAPQIDWPFTTMQGIAFDEIMSHLQPTAGGEGK